MIDLRFELPTSLEVGGRLFALNTDFRTWIEWLRCYREEAIASYCIFEGERPDGTGWVPAALEFAQSENATPRKSGEATRETFDFILDGDYLVGSFMQAYGINLATVEGLHWHVFLALFRSLPEGTKMAEIMGYRGWSKNDAKKKMEKRYEEAQRMWRLPPKKTAESKAIIEWQKKAFGNIAYP